MDVKKEYNYISKRQLLARVIKLEIDGNLIRWTNFFMTNRKVQLVINGHDNLKKDIEIGILQGSLVSSILFLIYISGVFIKVSEVETLVSSLFFVNNLGFVTLGNLIKKVVKTLEKVTQVVFE